MADNITHGLAAALLAQAGLRQRYGALATVALVVGSELPDLDWLFELGGPVSGFVNHRGMTHSLFGGAGLALLGAVLLWRAWRSHPYWRVTWLVYLGVLLHIGMDYLTSYGTRLFLPFDAGRYTADAVFIVDFTYSALMITGLLLVRMVRRHRHARYCRASLVWVAMGASIWLAAPALVERPLALLAWQRAGLHVMVCAAVVGLIGAVASATALRSVLFQVTPAEPLIYLLVGAVLSVATGVACWFPAQRATRVDPIVTLRTE